MYKDKDKQREAVRQAVARHRARKKECNTRTDVIPKDDREIVPVYPMPQSYNPMMIGYVPPGCKTE